MVSEEKIKKNRPIRNKNCLWWPCLLMDRDKISNLYRWPSIDAIYHILVHLGKRFQRRRCFRNQPIKNKMACGNHVCTQIGTKWAIFIEDIPWMLPTKFWFIKPGGFRGEDFLQINQSETRMTATLVTDWDEMSNLYRGPSIDASYQVSVHLAKRFQRRCLKIGQSETRIACGGHVC